MDNQMDTKYAVVDSKILQNRIQESELFSKRFGTFSKSDYEVLMFTIYLDSLDRYIIHSKSWKNHTL